MHGSHVMHNNMYIQYLSYPQNSHLLHSPSSFANFYLNNSPQMIYALLLIFHLQNVLSLIEKFKSSILYHQHSMHPATTMELAVCAESIFELVLFKEMRLPEMTVFLLIRMLVSKGWQAWTQPAYCVFSFTFEAVLFLCAVVHWFDEIPNRSDKKTRMQTVKPSFNTDHSLFVGIIHLLCSSPYSNLWYIDCSERTQALSLIQ